MRNLYVRYRMGTGVDGKIILIVETASLGGPSARRRLLGRIENVQKTSDFYLL